MFQADKSADLTVVKVTAGHGDCDCDGGNQSPREPNRRFIRHLRRYIEIDDAMAVCRYRQGWETRWTVQLTLALGSNVVRAGTNM